MARVLVAGESWQTLSLHIKGFDSFFTSEYKEGVGSFREALEHGGHSVDFQPNHVAAVSFPDTVEALSEYGVVFLSDIGSNTLLMPPVTFAFGESRPNRLVALRSWVAGGGGLAMIGGYLSFQGIEGKGNYAVTPLADALPVELERGDDRSEVPEGAVVRTTGQEHSVIEGLPEEWPLLLGFQRLVPREGATVLATINDWPLLVVWQYGQGRVLAFASDIGPHWAPAVFTEWSGYTQLWAQAASWLGQETK